MFIIVLSCDICQWLGKGCKLPIACLHPLAIMNEPCKRIAIDIVGRLPVCTNIGNKFILTIIDHCTQFPEAIPFVRLEAIDITKALVSVFSRFDFPHEILLDLESEFLSNLMTAFLDEFGISHINISLYHPATNGSCERFNGTMKSMICALVDKENAND